HNTISRRGSLSHYHLKKEMNLEIKELKNVGDLSRERIVLKATADTEIGTYVVFITRKGIRLAGVLGGPVPHSFWFPNQKVKRSDLIILYTKKGPYSKKENSSGSVSYFYYWDKEQPLLPQGRNAVLAELEGWENLEIMQDDLTEE